MFHKDSALRLSAKLGKVRLIRTALHPGYGTIVGQVVATQELRKGKKMHMSGSSVLPDDVGGGTNTVDVGIGMIDGGWARGKRAHWEHLAEREL